ncbi:MAG TPA: hypothetical protein PKA06_07060, partial [Gemmatales bacterium]|nr:hypothetical protein [Gemmatales bacterium]
MPKLLQAAREMADVFLLDVVASFDDVHFETLWASDHIVLVVEQTIPYIRAANMMKDALLRARPPKQVHLVVNKYDPEISSYSASALSQLLNVTRVHTIPDDRKHALQSSAEGRTLRKLDGSLPIVKAYRDLVQVLLGFSDSKEKTSGHFLVR